jgi:cysteine sulfinate desulfinase/cysteine desulfurase-like protein
MAKPLTAADHREIARLLRRVATERADREERERIMLVAIEHEAIAEELDRLEGE